MLNTPLLKQSFKTTRFLWLAITFSMAGMLAQFIFLDFGGEMVSMIYYKMTAIVLSGIYIMVAANKLIAVQVDRGSMAYVLSNPVKRSTVALTQLSYLIATVFGSYALTTIVHLIAAAVKDTGETAAHIIAINLGALLTTLVIGGICFMMSCIFNLSRHSLGLGGAITAFSFICYFVSMFALFGSENMKNFKYFTFVTLYDIDSILSNGGDWIWKFVILAGIAAVTFIVGTVTFMKRDLPL
jgi:ABC-2 type transport system permease protein